MLDLTYCCATLGERELGTLGTLGMAGEGPAETAACAGGKILHLDLPEAGVVAETALALPVDALNGSFSLRVDDCGV